MDDTLAKGGVSVVVAAIVAAFTWIFTLGKRVNALETSAKVDCEKFKNIETNIIELKEGQHEILTILRERK